MRRREFLGVTAAAWPVAARAQQSMPVIAYLRSSSVSDTPGFLTAFRQGLKEAGYVEGQNVAVEYHSAENQPDRLRSLVAALVAKPPAVIVANNASAQVVKAATTTIPLVFAGGGDPIKVDLVTSLNRPGGNVTGVHFIVGVLGRSDWVCCAS
jgi:putative ABC transport system substrate-binding protein